MDLAALAEEEGISPKKLAGTLLTTTAELGSSVGLPRDALSRADRVFSVKTQQRLRGLTEIINKIEPRFGNALLAYAWYRSEPIPGFGGNTAMQMVRAGHQDDVLTYIDSVDAGIHA